jgi:putative ABC transport system permease protein
MLADLRFVVRSLRRTPGFTVLAAVILAFGIGAATSMFSIADALVLRPVSLPEPERLYAIYETNLPRNQPFFSVSARNYLDWRERTRSWAGLAAIGWQAMNLTGRDAPEMLRVRPMSASLVPTLGLTLARGRNFLPAEDQPGQGKVALITASFSRRYFGTLDAVDRTLLLNGTAYTVVGVLADRQHLPTDLEVAIPLAIPADSDRMNHDVEVIGRLAPGVSADAADAELKAVAAAISLQLPATEQGWSTRLVPFAHDVVGGNVRTQVLVLLGAVALLLLIACANLSSLLSVRSAARAYELAVRTALGATRARVMRPIVFESILLALLGGAGGVLLSWWAVDFARTADLPRAGEIALDVRVLSVASGLTVLVGLVAGLVPAWHASRSDPRSALQSRSAQSGHRSRLRDTMVVAQIAFSLALVVSTALLGRSFWRLLQVDPGFKPDRVLAVALHPTQGQGSFYERLLARVSALPGVEMAGVTSGLPLADGNTSLNVFPHGPSPLIVGESIQANWRLVGGDYFNAMGIPLLRGRSFAGLSKKEAAASVVISASLAKALFGDADPIGRGIDPGGHGRVLPVIGIVGDVRHGSLGAAPVPTFYWSMHRFIYGPMHLAVRTAGEPTAILGALRTAAREIDPTVPLFRVHTLEELRDESTARQRLALQLFGGFAAAALVLAALGTYGVVAFAVQLRTREIGIRVAVGAQRRDVMQLVLGRTLRLASIGIAAGLALAFAGSRLLASLLYATSPNDTLSYAVGIAGLLLAALAAGWLPARRAAKVDPMVALRAE